MNEKSRLSAPKLFWIGLIVVSVLCLATGVYMLVFSKHETPQVANTIIVEAAPSTEKKPEPPPAKPKPEKPVVKVEPKKPAPQKAPEPKKEPEKPKEPEKTPEPKPEAPPLIVAGNERRINDPKGTYILEPLNHKIIRLTGKVRTLKIDRLENYTSVDAKGLQAEEIIVSGTVDNSKLFLSAPKGKVTFTRAVAPMGTVDIKAPNGTVEFQGKIDGHSRVKVDAPEGSVQFNAIDDASKVEVVAKTVDIRGTVSGDNTRVTMTFTRGGLLKFNQLEGNIRLDFKNADWRDPEPTIVKGCIPRKNQLHRMFN